MRLFLLLILSLLGLQSVTALRGKVLSEKELQALEDSWDEEEDRDDPDAIWEYKEDPNNPDGPKQKHPKPGVGDAKSEMAFVTIKVDHRRDADALASQWTQVLGSGANPVRCYVISESRILIIPEKGTMGMIQAQNWLSQSEDVLVFEYNKNKVLGKHPDAQEEYERQQGVLDKQAEKGQKKRKQREREEKRRKKKEAKKRGITVAELEAEEKKEREEKNKANNMEAPGGGDDPEMEKMVRDATMRAKIEEMKRNGQLGGMGGEGGGMGGMGGFGGLNFGNANDTPEMAKKKAETEAAFRKFMAKQQAEGKMEL